MHPLIDKLFKKRGIESVKDLSPDEKQTFEQWDSILSKDEITVKDIKQFCESQVGVIEAKWRNVGVKQEEKSEMIPYHTVYKMIISAIDANKVERGALEAQLNKLLE
jgi:hypothetical protein